MLYFNITLSQDLIISKVTGFFHKATNNRWQDATPQTLDALQLEINRIEQAFADMGTRPSRVVCTFQPTAQISEHQKIIDLAG